jgi:hypothetical protein
MFERSFQAKFLIPMAVTLSFGLTFATVVTLVLVPCLNMVYFDGRALFVGRHPADEDAPSDAPTPPTVKPAPDGNGHPVEPPAPREVAVP